MATCARNPNHVYPDHNTSCPWCAKDAAVRQIALAPVQAPQPKAAPLPRPGTQPVPHAAVPPVPAAPPPPNPPPLPRASRALVVRVLAAWAITSATVLVPWLLGAHVLRDTAWRPRSSLLTDTSTRQAGDYFSNDYVAGLTLTTLAAGALLLASGLRDPRRRVGRLVAAIALGSLAFAVFAPRVPSGWADAELATARDNAAQEHYDGCGFDTTTFTGAGGLPHTWTATGVDTGPSGLFSSRICEAIRVWDGSTLVNYVPTPAVYDDAVAVHPGATPDQSWVTFVAAGPPVDGCTDMHCPTQYDIVGGFPFTSPSVAWTANIKATNGLDDPAGVFAHGPLLVMIEQPGSPAGTVTAFTASTGQVAWRSPCPADFPKASELTRDENGVLRVLCYEASDFSYGNVRLVVNDDGSLAPDSAS